MTEREKTRARQEIAIAKDLRSMYHKGSIGYFASNKTVEMLENTIYNGRAVKDWLND